MQARSRRHHSGLADAMIHQAVEQFLPSGVAGLLLAVMLGRFAECNEIGDVAANTGSHVLIGEGGTDAADGIAQERNQFWIP